MATIVNSLELAPGKSLGPLNLGASLSDVLRTLSLPHNYQIFGYDDTQYQVIYSQSRPLARPVVVQLPAVGISLIFDPLQLVLRCIHVDIIRASRSSRVKVCYGVQSLYSIKEAGFEERTVMNYEQVYDLFGPTHPGNEVPGASGLFMQDLVKEMDMLSQTVHSTPSTKPVPGSSDSEVKTEKEPELPAREPETNCSADPLDTPGLTKKQRKRLKKKRQQQKLATAPPVKDVETEAGVTSEDADDERDSDENEALQAVQGEDSTGDTLTETAGASHIYVLHYSGISFAFRPPKNVGTAMDNRNDYQLTAVAVYSTESMGSGELGNILVSQGLHNVHHDRAMGSQRSIPVVLACVGAGIWLSHRPVKDMHTWASKADVSPDEWIQRTWPQGITLAFHEAEQDIIHALGVPAHQYHKEASRMVIHSQTSSGTNAGDSQEHEGSVGATTAQTSPRMAATAGPKIDTDNDYFLNYPDLGLDILINGRSHRAVKYILHTNMPGTYDFGDYCRCDFQMVEESNAQEILDSLTVDGMQAYHGRMKDNTTNVAWHSTFADIEGRWGKCPIKPVIYRQSMRSGNSNPFGASEYHAYPGAIFEVLKSGHIATVTMTVLE
eukprot:Clim_evm26s203 gene=Clim_evmTU26s203